MAPDIHRVVTTHNQGVSAVMIDDVLQPVSGFASDAVTIWRTHHHPAELALTDAAVHDGRERIYTTGSLIRVVDFAPKTKGHNHRTTSLDYGIVLSGEMELVLEDGSKTIVRPGDIVVQQATLHQWNNLKDEPCRMVFVLLASVAPIGSDGMRLSDLGIPDKFKATE